MRRRDAWKARGVFAAACAGLFLVLTGSAGAVPVSPPSSLTASAVSSSQINLTWVDTNSNETAVLVERSLSSSSGFVQIASLPPNTQAYSNTGLAAGTTYYYRVRAAHSGAFSAYSNVASARTLSSAPTATPPPPTPTRTPTPGGPTPTRTPTPSGTIPAAPSNLTAAAISSTQINLAWTDNSNNETAFRVERAPAAAGPWTYIGATTLTGYGDTGLAASTTYYYHVAAYNTAGTSAYTNTASATTQASSTVPSAPTSAAASAVSSSQINLVWVDTSSNETGFKIERSTSTIPWTQIGTTGASVTSYSSTGLSASTTYSYRVRATNATGDSAYSNTASATTSGAPLRWSRQFGDTADDRTQAVAVDRSGNVAVTGHFQGTTDFGHGSVSSYVQPNLGPTRDIFVAEYSPSGGYLWARAIGSDSSEEGKGIATDATGNVLVTGYQGSYAVDYGGGLQYTQAYNDIFIAKYSSAGAWVWSKTVGGYGYDQGNAIAADGAGNVFVTGYIGQGASSDIGVNFGGGALFSAGQSDVFLVKYSAAGAHIWSQRFGSTGNDIGTAVGTDSSGNVIVAGTFEGSVDFGGGALTSAGMRDIFVAKYSATGQHIWSKRFGSTGDDAVYGLAVNSLGDVALSGKFQGSVSFGGTALVSAGGDDAFVTKLSGSTGIPAWAKGFGSTSQDIANGVAVDGSGNVVITGQFSGTVSFGGNALTSLGIDVFAAKYDSQGTHLWSRNFGSTDTQIGAAVAAAPTGEVTLTGLFNQTIDFGTGTLTSAGGFDAFVAGIGP